MSPAKLEHQVTIKEYQPHEIVVNEGAANDRFFVILQGNVEILQNNKTIRVLTEGDVFGIENHYLGRLYTTTAIAISRCRVAAYHIQMMREILYDRPQLTEQILKSVMRQLEQTTQVAEEHIPFEKVVDINEVIYQDGEVIIEEGADGKEIYRLIETNDGLQVSIQGNEVAKITQAGEYFGEMSALLNEKRSATITSLGRSVVQVFNVEDLGNILELYPKLAVSIIDTLAKRLYDANKRLT